MSVMVGHIYIKRFNEPIQRTIDFTSPMTEESREFSISMANNGGAAKGAGFARDFDQKARLPTDGHSR